ncbi:MAG: FAD:protein FMN transferase, partial [Bacteroidales bacterium]|nr:FAD:protein FMN transferase [Bacteroidales bacterium]
MKRICYCFFNLMIILSSCNSKMPHNFTGKGIGTFYSITYTNKEYPNLQSEIESVFDQMTVEFSIFDTTSMVSKVNKNQPTTLSNNFIQVFNQAMKVSEITDGAFDITIGALVNFWGFGANKRDPTTVLNDSIKSLCHY